MATQFVADRLFTGVEIIERPILVVEDGHIVELDSQLARPLSISQPVIRLDGATLAPGFFDIHIHGSAGHDVMEATPEAFATIGSFLARHGTTRYLATTVTASIEDTLRALDGMGRQIRLAAARPTSPGAAQPLGIHLEGPFLSHAKRGVHPPELLLQPDIAILDRFIAAADNQIRLITLAPELAGAAEFAAYAISRGIQVSLGHSNATAAETRCVLAAGARSATHTFNAMRAIDHREPGIAGVTLATDELYAELICDGVHVAPEMVRIWWRAKGSARGILVTDAMAAAGMPDGEYSLCGYRVQVADGRATANGVLAGSVLTLDQALERLIHLTGAGLAAALPTVSANPAAATRLSDHAGHLAAGLPADFVALGAAGELRASYLGGVVVVAA